MRFFSKLLIEKELRQIFRKMSLYLISIFFFSIPPLYYFLYNDFFSFTKLIPITEFFHFIPLMYLLILPVLSIVSWSKESLFLESLPFSTAQIIFSKLISLAIILFILLFTSLFTPLYASVFISFDWAQVCTAFIFLFMYGIFLLSLGQAISILFKHSISALVSLSLIIIFTNQLIASPWAFKGIIDFFEISSLLLSSFFFILLAIFIKEKQKEKKYLSKTIFLVVIAFILCFFNFKLFSIKIDFTKNKAFSISEKTMQSFEKLDDELCIEYYLSPALEKQFPQVKEVKEYLVLLEKRVNNVFHKKIDLKIYNPEKMSNVAIQKAAIQSQQIQTSAKGQRLFQDMYSAIRLHYLNKTLTIPFILSLNGFEYSLYMQIEKLLSDFENPVYMYFANKDSIENYALVVSLLLEEGFQPIDIESLNFENLNLQIPLIVIGSNERGEYTPSIESFIMQGGNAIFFVSKTNISFADWTAIPKPNDSILDMLDYWGFEIQDGILIDLEQRAKIDLQNIETNSIETIDYPLWAKVKEGMTQNLLTHTLDHFIFYWPSPMKIFPSNTQDDNKVLFFSSEHSLVQKETENSFIIDPFVLEHYRYENQMREQFVLGAIFEGELYGYYTAGKSQSTKIIVIPDELCISNYMEDFQAIRFLTNVLLYFQNKKDLILLKNKTQSQSNFNSIVHEKIQREQ